MMPIQKVVKREEIDELKLEVVKVLERKLADMLRLSHMMKSWLKEQLEMKNSGKAG